MMKKCAHCGSRRLGPGTDELTFTVAGRPFTVVTTDAVVCAACGESFVSADVADASAKLVAKALVTLGERSGQALRFVRKALGYRAAEIADLLDLTEQHWSRYENDRIRIPNQVFALLGAMADDALGGRRTTLAMLEALKRTKPRPRRAVRLELGAPTRAAGARR